MKLKYTLLALAGIASLTANAQTAQPMASDAPAHRVALAHQPGANYFISLAGGVGAMFLEGNNKPALMDRLSWTAALSLGKWHNPYYANRLKFVGGESYTFNNVNGLRSDNYFVGGHLDFMLDVVNYFSAYNPSRVFHVIPYVGVGYEHKFNHTDNTLPNTHSVTANGGLQISLHVAPRVNIFAEAEATYSGLNVRYHYAPAYSNALRLSALAGLSFNIGRQGFTAVEPLDQEYLDGLQAQINALRAENAELSKRPVNCPDVEAPAALVTENRFVADKSILFAQGKAIVSKDQLITVFDAAEFAKKPECELIVTGYVAKNESRYKALAEQRAKAVATLLTEKYGVSADKITVEWKEAGEAPYGTAQKGWNRVVIIRSK